MGSRLLPCPFCGGKARMVVLTSYPPKYQVEHSCEVVCAKPAETPEQAIEAWNTRYERTCHKCNPGEADWFVCSECGCQCAGDQYGELPKYCANCGAKVVS